jgi:YHS domain-containing protein
MQKMVLILLLMIAATACNNQPPKGAAAEKTKAIQPMPVAKTAYTHSMVDNKKDFACGMPVTAGIADTCHYKGKAYGFCSKECMNEFLQQPDVYLAAKK